MHRLDEKKLLAQLAFEGVHVNRYRMLDDLLKKLLAQLDLTLPQ